MNFKINMETPNRNGGIIPNEVRGVITGSLKALPSRTGGDVSNAEYAKEHGITKRAASKARRGY